MYSSILSHSLPVLHRNILGKVTTEDIIELKLNICNTLFNNNEGFITKLPLLSRMIPLNIVLQDDKS